MLVKILFMLPIRVLRLLAQLGIHYCWDCSRLFYGRHVDEDGYIADDGFVALCQSCAYNRKHFLE